jgi:hypothetical protein
MDPAPAAPSGDSASEHSASEHSASDSSASDSSASDNSVSEHAAPEGPDTPGGTHDPTTAAACPRPDASLPERGHIGLSFSGGGYRATAFSLGTMALLQDLGLLGKARVMSSVSGGSLALAAYLCAKAGDRPDNEADFRFYERFWKPMMLAFADEGLAEAFVRLPLLLQGEKLILHAADSTQRFLNTLLGQEASLGNEAITAMLRNRALSPDYVFFNAANIASLDLFRFGIQRGGSAEAASSGPPAPVLVLNRYFLRPEGGTVEAAELYGHARHLRLGDCVAASFAFPGGFEPLIFPHDYFRPECSPAGPRGAELARDHFSGSLICDRRPYIAFLDGGLYDNLGLASVEDIRAFLARRCRDLEEARHCPGGDGPALEQEQAIHYVIATDVDNIQPGIGFYSEPSLEVPPGAPQRQRPGRLHRLGDGLRRLSGLARALLGVGLPPLLGCGVLGFLVGMGLFHPPARALLPWLLLLLIAGVVAALLWSLRGVGGRLGRLIAGLGRRLGLAGPLSHGPSVPASPPTWRQRLGLSTGFDRSGIDNDLGSVLLRALAGLLRRRQRPVVLAHLRTAVFERRLGQLLPAFNGYLKRTRSLTYGYLQQAYDAADAAHRPPAPGPAALEIADSAPERCHLIRNMIFELIAGPDIDPAYAANLITLPVRDYQRQAAITPLAPIIRKLRHAEYVRDLLARLDPIRVPKAEAGPREQERRMALPLALVALDPDLERSRRELALSPAACLWTWLTASLELDGVGAAPGAPNPTLGRLVLEVHGLLRRALDAACRAQPGVAEPLIRHSCSVKISEDATSYSWIPLICEMATNLNTTLWVKGYRWYRPNRLEGQRIVAVGGWYVVPPPPVDDGRPLLDLGGSPAPAAAITTLAGYLNTCFNLLEFFYASFGTSVPALDGLVQELIRTPIPSDDRGWLQDLVDLPYPLRQAAHERLLRRSRCPDPPLSPGQVALLEPWLTSRDGFPESWRETFGSVGS